MTGSDFTRPSTKHRIPADATCEIEHNGEACGRGGETAKTHSIKIDGSSVVVCSAHCQRHRKGKTGDDFTRPSTKHRIPADATCEIEHEGEACGRGGETAKTHSIKIDGSSVVVCGAHCQRHRKGKTGSDFTRPIRPRLRLLAGGDIEYVKADVAVVASAADVAEAGVHPAFLMGGSHPVALAWFARLAADDRFDLSKPPMKRLAATTVKSYEVTSDAFVRWCDDLDVDPLNVTSKKREKLVTTWLKEKAATSADTTMKSLRNALTWWATSNGLPDPVTEAAAYIEGKSAGNGKARPLTLEDLQAIIPALNAREIWLPTKTTHQDWCDLHHMRMKAAILTVIDCSLRWMSELPRLTDDSVVKLTPAGIDLKLDTSKMKKDAQDLRINFRGDELCAVTALHDFLQRAIDLGVDRHGQLIVAINRQSKRAMPDRSGPVERGWWKDVLTHCDIDPQTTPHGLRATLPTAAGNADWNIAQIRDLGRWAAIRTAAQYVHLADAEMEFDAFSNTDGEVA